MSYDYHTLAIKSDTEAVYEQAREAVAAELGDGEPTHDEVVRELAEAYCGRDACGEWQK